MPFRPLVPLRIPSGWEVVFNNFVELGRLEALGPEDRVAYLNQDLLTLRSSAPERSPSAGFALDVGWTPDGDPGGAYHLRVFDDAGPDAVVRLDSASADVIRDAVALCVNRLNEGAPPERIQALIDEATTVDGRRVE